MFYYYIFFFFSSRRRHTRLTCDWSTDVCSSDLIDRAPERRGARGDRLGRHDALEAELHVLRGDRIAVVKAQPLAQIEGPALAVGGLLPALGDAGADAAVLEVESHH